MAPRCPLPRGGRRVTALVAAASTALCMWRGWRQSDTVLRLIEMRIAEIWSWAHASEEALLSLRA